MRVSMAEKEELTAYQFKCVAQVWFNQWKEERAIDAGCSDVPAPKFNKDSLPNPKSQRGGGSGSSILSCQKCGNSNSRKCLASMDGGFGYGKNGHKMIIFLLLATKRRDCRKAQPNCSDLGAPCQNKFYALHT
ncbi:hypothetical protein MTR67_030655 [Solanum verrucosum]|uniref:Uncharacterized protein n=1 Tax=Solanum verrucosum TaxID=315347 RepID=A0AAF0U0T1_SOLVR|nr:hypothetical protein MTR67_030655 [Solanum verrucosum]